MKKFLLSSVMCIATIMCASARGESCAISGDAGSSIMVVNDSCDGKKITLDLENDSNSSAANISVRVKVNYGQYSREYSGFAKCNANSSTPMSIDIQPNINGASYTNYEIVSVSGRKCTM